MSLRRALPNLNALAVFECAARHGNLTRAARELGIAQSAVTRHVQLLEAETGLPLFRREGRAVRPTEAGRALAEAVASGFGAVRDTIARLGREAGRGLTIACSWDVAHLWLVPRLQALRRRMPEAAIRLITSDSYVDFEGADIDLSLRFGTGPWGASVATRLFAEAAFPVAAPALLAQADLDRPAALPPERIRLLPRLDLEERTASVGWADWFAAAGLPRAAAPAAARFRSYAFLLEACREGAGVALGWRHLVDDLLDRGLLVRLGAVEIGSDAGLQAVHRPDAGALVTDAVAALADLASATRV